MYGIEGGLERDAPSIPKIGTIKRPRGYLNDTVNLFRATTIPPPLLSARYHLASRPFRATAPDPSFKQTFFVFEETISLLKY
jgi:hypothetical protein